MSGAKTHESLWVHYAVLEAPARGAGIVRGTRDA